MTARLVSVAVPIPRVDRLTYRVPPELDPPPRGARVLVPLGPRLVTGCALGTPVENGAGAGRDLRDLADVLDLAPFVPADVLDLALWVADYYLCAPGEAIAAAVPPFAWRRGREVIAITDRGRAEVDAIGGSGARAAILQSLAAGRARPVGRLMPVYIRAREQSRRARATGDAGLQRGLHAMVASLVREGLVAVARTPGGHAPAFRSVRIASLTAEGSEVATSDQAAAALRLGRTGRTALEHLRLEPAGVAMPDLARRGVSADALGRLARRGLVSVRAVPVDRDPFGDGTGHQAFEASVNSANASLDLTAEQDEAVARLGARLDRGGFETAVLHGVTGSGKTAIYLRLARRAQEKGRGVLVLVPEIALTPAVAAAFRAAFGERVAVQHSGLSDGERHDQWHRIREGAIDVVVGTRSAVFAPIAGLGLVVVDEEHDSAYKQEEAPRYNGRDVAVMRAKGAGALVVLGSATPSLESYQHARNGRYTLVTMARRVLDRKLARVEVVDMRTEFAERGPTVVISETLRAAIDARLARGEQSLVLLNRRGYARAVFCRQCASTLECPNCSVCLIVHRAAAEARCHYCNHACRLPSACHACGGAYLEHTGFGTERVEAEIAALVPGARIARLDRDTVRRRHAVGRLLAQVARREIDVLVGTQMIAKGHDFPAVTLVGVVSADVGLGLADFRAAERTFQLLTQVAGRAGRGDREGEAIIQTLYPDHYSIRHACQQDYPAFFDAELAFRQAMRYPPAVSLVNVIVRGRTFPEAMRSGTDLVRRVRGDARGFRVLGPAPAPLQRLRGEHRVQFFLKGTNRAAMRAALREAIDQRSDLSRHVVIDVDPATVL